MESFILFFSYAPSKFDGDLEDCDKMYGCIPQVIIDNEADQIQNVHKSNSELVSFSLCINLQKLLRKIFVLFKKSLASNIFFLKFCCEA